MIDLQDVIQRIVEFKQKNNFNHLIEWECCKLQIEIGEMIEAIISKKEDLNHEIADVMICLLHIANMSSIDIESALLEKLDIIEKRQYLTIDNVITKK